MKTKKEKEKDAMQRSVGALVGVIASIFVLSYFTLPPPFSIEWILPFYVGIAAMGMYYLAKWFNTSVLARETSYKTLLDRLNTTIWKLDIHTMSLSYIEGSYNSIENAGIYDNTNKSITTFFTPESCELIKDTIRQKIEEWNNNKMSILTTSIDCQVLDTFGVKKWVALDMCFAPFVDTIVEVIIAQRDIDARKKEDLKISSHSKLLNHLCDNILDCLWIVDFKTMSVTYLNKSAFKIFGMFADDLVGKQLSEIVHKDVYEQIMGVIQKKIIEYKQGFITEIKETLSTKFFNVDLGKYIDVEISAQLTLDSEGNFKDIIGITKLLGNKLDTYKELEEKVKLFDLIDKNVMDDIFILNYSDKTYKYVSNGFSMLTGVSSNFVIGEKCSKYVDKRSYIEVSDQFDREVLRYKSQQLKEVCLNAVINMVHTAGRLVPVEIILTANIGLTGNIDYVVGIARSLENRISADNARNAELSRIANIAESSLDILWSMDVKSMRYIYVSPASLFSLGYAPSEMVGTLFSEFVSQNTTEEFHELLHTKLEEAIEKGTRLHIDLEMQMYHKMGYTVWVELSVTNLKVEGNATFEIVGTTKRIDSRKNAELQLIKQQAELQKLVDTRDKFFGIIGHDIKNPVSALMNTAELLEENYENMDKEMIKKQMQMITDSADHLYRLLDNLLQWSKHTSGEIPYRPNKSSITDIVMDATNHLKQQALYKDIAINYKFDTFGNNDVICDENMIKTVIINLVSNAIKYSSPKSLIEILVRTFEKDKRFLELVVIDFGIGMSTERLSKLFTFKKNKSIAGTNNEPGAGLGLILCKEFIDKHNTLIWCESELDKGSNFHFTLLKG